MKLKVCGMRDKQNIEQVAALQPDYMGFIFYEASSRFVGNDFNSKVKSQNIKVNTVGVFVNAAIEYVLEKVRENNLDYVQLHGNESVEYCKEIAAHVPVIKAFGINDDFDFAALDAYKPYVQYFLFDTATKQHGGSGKTFNWNKLKEYDNEIPFFLSGGVSLENINEVLALKGLNIHAIDVNSRFEVAPGLKDIEKLKLLKEQLTKVS